MSWDGRGVSDLAQHHARVGYELHEQGDLEGALRHYDRAAEEQATFPGLHRQRGWLHYQRGDFRKALSDLDAEIEMNPEDPQSYEYRARVRLAVEDPDGALRDYSWLVARSPDEPRGYRLRGLGYAEAGNLERALDDTSFAVEIDSRAADAYVSRGWVRMRRGELDRAGEDALRALDLDRTNPGANQLLGRLRLAEGNLGEARESFGRAVKKGWPEMSVAVLLTLEGRLLEARGRFETSVRDLWGHPELRDYAAIFLWLCERGLGRSADADQGLRRTMHRPSPRAVDWTGRIAEFLLGDTSEEQLRSAAASPIPSVRREREAQGWFYVGARRRMSREEAEASRAFRECIESGQRATYEWVLAKGEAGGPSGSL
jgi:tetratricopeptide (TPR) repeat protein